MEFSRSIAGHGVPSVLRSEDDLTAVMHVFEDRVLAGLRLW